MLKQHRTKLILSTLVILLPSLLGILLWDRLPEAITGYWGNSGTNSPAWKIIVLFPLILLTFHYLCLWLSFRDPKFREQNPKATMIVFWIIPYITLLSTGVMYCSMFDSVMDPFRLIPGSLGLLSIIIGNYMPKLKHNAYMGIRTPWTMYNDENWRASHRFCGKLYVILGLAMILCCFLPLKAILIIGGSLLLILCLGSSLYPYFYYRKQVEKGLPPISSKTMGKKLWVVVLILVVAVIFCAISLFTGEIVMECGEDALSIQASYWKDLTVNYNEIESVTYTENWDHGVRFSGYGSARLLMGTFKNDAEGHYTLYAYTKCPAAILIRSKGRLLVLGCKTPEETKALYEELRRASE
ncbi:MAG: SdpI family protein [Oscillospiraceae bacterium]|nr:SdpI family protein [Oscillospiraceae bacterium]